MHSQCQKHHLHEHSDVSYGHFILIASEKQSSMNNHLPSFTHLPLLLPLHLQTQSAPAGWGHFISVNLSGSAMVSMIQTSHGCQLVNVFISALSAAIPVLDWCSPPPPHTAPVFIRPAFLRSFAGSSDFCSHLQPSAFHHHHTGPLLAPYTSSATSHLCTGGCSCSLPNGTWCFCDLL